MKTTFTITLAAFAAIGLAGCEDTGVGAGTDPAALTTEQAACVRDVRAATQNPDVIVQNSQGSEAGTLVNLLVGGTGTWSCIGYSDGTTDAIQSTTDEGFL